MPKPRVVLAMIVKDEAHIIASCLARLRPFVDAWCIVDTGSTDETRAAVLEAMEGLSGELHERPWVNFAHNRTECFELARSLGDYVLVHDADDVWECPEDFEWPELSADGYSLLLRGGSLEWSRLQLLRSSTDWKYADPVHAIADPRGKKVEYLPGPVVRPTTDGRRHQGDLKIKYLKDAEIYEEAIKAEPDNLRYRFYLAESYRYAGEPRRALEAYIRRAQLGGWRDEVWYSWLQSGRLAADRGAAVVMLETAHQLWPARAEAAFSLSEFHNKNRDHALAHMAACAAMQSRFPPVGALFVEHQVYAWRAADQYAIACYYTGRPEEALRVNDALQFSAPEAHRRRIEKNSDFCRALISADEAPEGSGRRLLVVGCGRSGTGFLARVLDGAGIKCGHERVFSPATTRPRWGAARAESSWLAVPWLATLSRSDAFILHVVRDPLANARSWMGVGMFAANPDPRHHVYLDAVRRFAPGVLDYATPLERWLAHWVVWNETAIRYGERTVKIEDLDAGDGAPLASLCAELGLESHERVSESFAAVPRDFNTRTVDTELAWDDILACDGELVARLRVICDRVGYAVGDSLATG